MVQNIHPLGVIWDPNSAPYVERFQILKLLSKCSILEPSLVYLVTLTHSDFIRLPVKLMPKENRLLLHMEYWAFHCTDSFSNSLVVELQVSVQIRLYFCHILVEF